MMIIHAEAEVRFGRRPWRPFLLDKLPLWG
jgi:hypothetical protein